jgi:hypothetical protein
MSFLSFCAAMVRARSSPAIANPSAAVSAVDPQDRCREASPVIGVELRRGRSDDDLTRCYKDFHRLCDAFIFHRLRLSRDKRQIGHRYRGPASLGIIWRHPQWGVFRKTKGIDKFFWTVGLQR